MVGKSTIASGGRSGWLGLAVAVLGATYLVAASYMALEDAVSAHRDNSPDGAAGPTLTVDALQKLTAGERAQAEQAARRAFVRDPLDSAAVLDLSIIAESQGNVEAAERLRLSAGDMTPRSTRIQAEALYILLKRRDFEQVMKRLDGLIRAKPSEAPNFFALAAEIAATPEGSGAVAKMLASDPPWRAAFFASLRSQGKPETASRVMDALRSIGAPVEDSEVSGVIEAYLRAGDIDKAYAVWLSSLNEDELRDVKRIYDGGFAHPIRNLKFDWTVRPADGLIYRLFPRNTASMDQALQIDFVDFKGTVSSPSQLLRLRPGRYRLGGEVRFDSFDSPAGLVFRLYCLDAGKPREIKATAPLPQSSQWMAFDQAFDIPESACPAQVLQLESQFRLNNSQFTRGTVELDSLVIDIMAGLAP